MTEFFQISVAGISSGATYALVALGFSLVYSVSRILNLVQGEFMVSAALVTIWLLEAQGWPLLAAAVVGIAVTSALAVAFHRMTLLPSRGLAPDVALMVTFGGAYVFRGICLVLFGKDSLSLQAFSGEAPLVVADVAISPQTLWALLALAVVSVGLWAFFQRTVLGKAMLACADNPAGAQLVGIDLKTMAVGAFAVAAAIGALAGIVSAPLSFVSYDAGLGLTLKGFIAAVFGGIGSYPGAVVGGILIGLLEAFSARYLSSEYKEALAFGALLLLLLVRPRGILGKHA
jgi:branched-chain amino acid transport system permease protein